MSTVERRQVGVNERFLVRFRANGKSRAKTFRTEAHALKWQAILDAVGPTVALDLWADKEAGKAVAAELTVAAWTASHIDALSGVTDGTRSDYRTYLVRDIEPGIGHLPLRALTREAIGAWVNTLAARGLSGKSIKNRHSLLSAALTSAVRAGHIPTNHAKGVRLPRTDHERVEMILLTQSEQNAFISCFAVRYQPLVAALLLTGLRWGEITALTVAHVDLDAGLLHVRQAWKHVDGSTPELGPPKSRRGTRTLAIGGDLHALFAAQVEGKGAGDWVFTAPRGGPLRHTTFYDGAWSPAVSLFAGDFSTVTTRKKMRGPGKRPRIHDMRHTHVSTLINMHVQPMYIQRRLGHESIQTTMDVYGHLMDDSKEAMAAAVSAGFAHLDFGARPKEADQAGRALGSAMRSISR